MLMIPYSGSVETEHRQIKYTDTLPFAISTCQCQQELQLRAMFTATL